MIARPPANPRGLRDFRIVEPARPRGEPIAIEVDGDLIRAHVGEPVAVALFAAGVRVLARSPKYHRPRGLFCGTGHCGSCLMRIDGRPNVRSCMTPATPNLRCERQNAVPDADLDLLAAADWMFPAGMDHHRLMTGTRIGNELFVKLVRRMGGTGTLPDAPATDRPAPRDRHVDVCVVGAGPAGLTAARGVAEGKPGVRVLVIDDQDVPGGSLLAEPDGWAQATALVQAAHAAGVEIASSSSAVGVYPPASPEPTAGSRASGTLAVVTPAGLWRVTADRFIYATGAYDQNLPIADNDRPGTLAARALGRLVFLWGVAPEGKITVVSPSDATDIGPAAAAMGDYLKRLQQALAARGLDVRQITVDDLSGVRRIDRKRDVLAVGPSPAPASELARQHGGRVQLEIAQGGFAVAIDPDGRAATGIFCAGDVTGYLGPTAAAIAGARVGTALVRGL